MPDKAWSDDDAIVSFIDLFLKEHRFAPSVRDVAVHFGVQSSDTVQKRLIRLRGQGRVSWLPGQPRTLVANSYEQDERS